MVAKRRRLWTPALLEELQVQCRLFRRLRNGKGGRFASVKLTQIRENCKPVVSRRSSWFIHTKACLCDPKACWDLCNIILNMSPFQFQVTCGTSSRTVWGASVLVRVRSGARVRDLWHVHYSLWHNANSAPDSHAHFLCTYTHIYYTFI